MILSFDLEEANTILSALSDMDDFFLPKSVPRRDLYILVNKLIRAMDLKMKGNGEMPIPNLFLDQFDASKLVEIYLTQVEMDYVLCALHAMGFEGTGYPKTINLAASRVYNKVNAQFVDVVIDHPENDVWEIIVPGKELLGSEDENPEAYKIYWLRR
jgi:hypothetical protein